MTALWRRETLAARASQRPSWCSIHLVVWALLAWVASLSRPHAGQAQGDQFGGQARADAASRAIVLAVQQGISALPPTSGQSLIYAFNRKLDVPVRSEQLGPTALRAPETVEEGNVTVRA